MQIDNQKKKKGHMQSPLIKKSPCYKECNSDTFSTLFSSEKVRASNSACLFSAA
jgi:hypothetical protein